MTMRSLAPPLLLVCTVILAGSSSARTEPSDAALDAAIADFLAAPGPDARLALVDDVIATGADFDDVFARLRAGRTYSTDVPRGRLVRQRVGDDGTLYPYIILIPESYDPAIAYPVRFELHGGMGVDAWDPDDGAWAGPWQPISEQIVVLPAGWWDRMWWEGAQVDNVEAILDEVKRTWHIDENRVVLVGSSDGCIALFFHAMRHPDRWAGYGGHVGPPDRLVRAEMRPDGQMHPSNVFGQRFHLGYGERDPKAPIKHLRAYMALFEQQGGELDWYVNPRQGHALTLTDDQERAFGRFLWNTRRDALPERVSWSTERTDRYNRRGWVVIDGLEPADPDHEVDTSNILPRWGSRIQLRGATTPARPWGRIDAVRDGNEISVTTRRVARLTLLISPGVFSLEQPLRVELDGALVHDAVVEPSLDALLTWAARDDETSRLFAAALTFDVAR